MKALVVLNPKASGGRAARMQALVKNAFSEGGVTANVVVTHDPGDATEIIANASLSAYDAVVAAGGDGTVFEVVNGLFRHPPEKRKPLGIIPAGTGNAFARELGLKPGQWDKGVRIITAGWTQPVDVARISTTDDDFYFINVAAMGFASRAGKTAVKLKWVGKAAYTLATLWQTLRLDSYPLRIEVDGELIEQDNVMLAVSNSRYTGTSFLLAPRARMDDGLLDITLIRRLSRRRLLRLLPTVYSGRHVQYPEVTVMQGKHIRLLQPQGFELITDGEFRGSLPAEIDCIPAGLDLFAPRITES